MVLCGDRGLLSAGCCAGLRAFSWVKSQSAQTKEPTNGMVRLPREMPIGIKNAEKEELEKKVTRMLEPHLVSLQATLTDELSGAMQRLLKAQGGASPFSPGKWKARLSRANTDTLETHTLETPGTFVRATSAGQAAQNPEADLPKDEDLPMVRRTGKRRWTTAMGNIGGALSTAILRIGVGGSLEGDTPGASTVVSAAASEVASEGSKASRRPSLKDNDSKSSRTKPRITFEGMDEGTPAICESDGEANEDANPRSDRGSETSSMAWRTDALDVGQNLAAEAAAKKGTASVDSIVALVQVERERWEEEKQALEARIEELKEQQRALQASNQPDAEKEALKKEYQDLRKAMKARSRFGAWVCARHMMESEDEETDAEKEELRYKISELSAKLRRAKALMGAASSESDVSPSRRSPGIMRRKFG